MIEINPIISKEFPENTIVEFPISSTPVSIDSPSNPTASMRRMKAEAAMAVAMRQEVSRKEVAKVDFSHKKLQTENAKVCTSWLTSYDSHRGNSWRVNSGRSIKVDTTLRKDPSKRYVLDLTHLLHPEAALVIRVNGEYAGRIYPPRGHANRMYNTKLDLTRYLKDGENEIKMTVETHRDWNHDPLEFKFVTLDSYWIESLKILEE